MSTREATETIQVLASGDPRREQALRLILSGHIRPDADVDRRLRTLEYSVSAQQMNLDLLVAASRGAQLCAAGMAIVSPGRHALVHLSRLSDSLAGRNIMLGVLRELQHAAWQRDLVMLQALQLPEETHLEHMFSAAGFRFLAELIYADRVRGAPVPPGGEATNLELLTYTPARRGLFLRALEQTYTESLDCAALSGVRRTEDVLAGHQATGCHDPSLWFLARGNDATAGVLLLSPWPDRNLWEVVYLGVAAYFRRHGVGHALMRRCHDAVMARHFAGVTLAVDSVNTPARALYQKWGFVETGRRRAWIALRPR